MFGTILSSIAALSLVAAGIHAVVRQRTAANFVLLVTGALLAAIEVVDQLSLRLFGDFDTFRLMALYGEALLPASFLLLGLTYRRSGPFQTLSKTRLGFMAALALSPLVILVLAGKNLYYAPDVRIEGVLFLDSGGYWFYIAIMVSFIIALANIEATLTATHGIARNRMKFEAFGIMSLLAVLIFYYSQGLLYRTINMNLLPVRSSVFLIASFLIWYAQAFRGSDTRVSISRHVLYRSVALLVVGCYLLGLGFIGEGMRYFGEAFGKNVAIVTAFLGGIFLLAVLFSDKARRRTKVYISKHFYANKHDYREEWIRLNDRLSSCATLPEVQEAVIAAYEETFGLAGASLYLLDRDERRYVRAAGHFMPEVPAELYLSDALRDYFARRERVLNLLDGECPLSEQERAILARVQARLVVPLISGGKIEGLVALREQIVPEALIYDDFDLMKVMARQAAQAIENLRLSEKVMEMQAIAAVSRISAFVIHDLKNLMSGLSLVVDNAGEHIGNPEFQQDAITTIQNTLVKMNGLMQRLRTIPEKNVLASKVEDLDRLSRATVSDFAKLRPGASIVYRGCESAPLLSCVDGEEIRKVIINLVVNALEASDARTAVRVETSREHGGACVRVSDSGKGMTADFMKHRLFRPFSTTKKNGLGIGLYQCRQIVEAHGGRIEVSSEVDKGTIFTVRLPAAEAVGE